ncbi:ParB/RepB/Spo0J family partition protein [Pontiella sulfatireligans]|uniref:Nucleoid occlusion protein n=1 Tax=Pontiella sulfatireligans TaxID=2750658 RepID=A0A6C2UG10_9BACT|nr:ParB N-terminal domain-containing protein [Pontiella sulfatireligans]VGO19152.1 Nucleoid occlusion protein [Pontiella sulfatireligans]
MNKPYHVEGIDVPLSALKPLRERTNINTAKHRGYLKILASIRSLGLIEPFCVFHENGQYIILDGYLRWLAFQELELETAPCVVFKDKEAYTFNRMVNNLSSFQEMRMLRKSMESVDEKTIAETFGMKTIRHRLAPKLVERLHPQVAQAFKNDLIGKTAASEMSCVKPARQLEMLREMNRVGDHTPAFIRALVLKTPPELRLNTPGTRYGRKKNEREQRLVLVERLEQAEKQHDFYTKLYRTYSADLLKISLYVRKVITTPEIREFMEQRHPSVLGEMRAIVMDSK